MGHLVIGFAIRWEDFEFSEGRSFPVSGTQNDGKDTRLVSIMPSDRLHHFTTITEIRGDEVSAYQQQNDLIGVQMLADL